MALHLSYRQTQWAKLHGTQLRIQKPRKIADIEHITVAIPNSYFRKRETLSPGTRRYSSTILALMQLGITELKFERYEDDEEGMRRTTVPVTEHAVADFLRDMIDLMRPCNPWTVKLDDGTEYVLGQGCAIDTIAFDWGKFTGAFADEDLILPYYAGDKPLDRNVELRRELVCGPTTGAVWTRKPYTWYGKVVEDFWGKMASSGSFLVMGL